MKILVVDDHALIREALRGVLKELKGDAEILEAPNARLAMHRIEENPDIELTLLDLNLPDGSGLELLRALRERYPAISVVVLSASDERENVAKALDLGALGFIPKSSPREVMLSAFNLIFAGGIYVPPEILAPRAVSRPPATHVQPSASASELGLTDRQMDVLAPDDAGKEQQGDLSCSRSRRTDREKSRHRDFESVEGDQSNGGGHRGRRARHRIDEGLTATQPPSQTVRPPAWISGAD